MLKRSMCLHVSVKFFSIPVQNPLDSVINVLNEQKERLQYAIAGNLYLDDGFVQGHSPTAIVLFS